VADDKAIICSEQGDICLLDDAGPVPQLLKITEVQFSIQSAVICPNNYLLVGGNQGRLVAFQMETLLKFNPTEPASVEVDTSLKPRLDYGVVALGSINNVVITLDSRRKFQVLTLSQNIANSSQPSKVKQLPAHGSAVLGVQALTSEFTTFNATYFTWSAEGLVLFWDHDGNSVGSLQTLMQGPNTEIDGSNELKTVSIVQKDGLLISGDKHGWIRLVRQGLNIFWSLTVTESTTFPPGRPSLKTELILEKLLISRYLLRQSKRCSLLRVVIAWYKFVARSRTVLIYFKHLMNTWEL